MRTLPPTIEASQWAAPPAAKVYRHEAPFDLGHGGVLEGMAVAYETWGQLDSEASNAVLVHTGLSGSSHARSSSADPSRGWWETFIGPGAVIDTDQHFVICANVLGGCFGSTGPASTNPATGRPYGPDFPLITVQDMVRAQLALLDHLGIGRLHAAVGGSLGGMQALAIAAEAPDRVARMVSISAAARSYPSSIATRYAQRRAVMADPYWRDGRYYGHPGPTEGMKVARAMGTISYRSGPEWDERFGRSRNAGEPRLGTDFAVESYIEHQSDKFARTYDANSYLYISKAMDLFDLGELHGARDGFTPSGLAVGLRRVTAPSLVIGVSTDVLFPVWQQREIANGLIQLGRNVEYTEVDAPQGHDSFLILEEAIGSPVRQFLERPADAADAAPASLELLAAQ